FPLAIEVDPRELEHPAVARIDGDHPATLHVDGDVELARLGESGSLHALDRHWRVRSAISEANAALVGHVETGAAWTDLGPQGDAVSVQPGGVESSAIQQLVAVAIERDPGHGAALIGSGGLGYRQDAESEMELQIFRESSDRAAARGTLAPGFQSDQDQPGPVSLTGYVRDVSEMRVLSR